MRYLRYALGPAREAPKEGRGWMFAADAGLALPSVPAPSIINSRANAMPASSSVRLQGRYELGAQVNERLGV